MRSIFVSLVLVCLAGLTPTESNAQTRIYRCGGTYTNSAAEAEAKGCKVMEGGNVRIVGEGESTPVIVRATAAQTKRFRETIKVGDDSSEGLVIEVKRPIVKIQTNRGQRWFRIDEIAPPSVWADSPKTKARNRDAR